MNTPTNYRSSETGFKTIAAIATPLGEGGIGVIRISGDDAQNVLHRIFSKKIHLEPSKIYHGYIIEPTTNEQIDEVLAFYQQKPNSYTGEDVVEISGHGSIATLHKILDLAIKNGAELAQPGEFTKRAFLNGRIDLAQAEAVCDLIKAKTPEFHKIAFGQLKGKLSKEIYNIRGKLIDLISMIEASIDFNDDIGDIKKEEVKERLESIRKQIINILSTAEHGILLRSGIKAVIVGKPNVGKSSLLNKLLEEERALVSDKPGTTRDFIVDMINILGIPLEIIDTAGIRGSGDEIECMSMDKTLAQIREAGLVLFITDISQPLDSDDQRIVSELNSRKFILILNKSDIDKGSIAISEVEKIAGNNPYLAISALRGDGIEELKQLIY
ncbi:MAG: tRNA uridine-5-carboxymethylaminomethyl(34) synthesis GTPase MnmE, partial [bacterium]